MRSSKHRLQAQIKPAGRVRHRSILNSLFDNPVVCDGGPRLAPAGRTVPYAVDNALRQRLSIGRAEMTWPVATKNRDLFSLSLPQ
jgi:hypothetical protein